MSIVLPSPPQNLSLTGLLAQRRRHTLSTRTIQCSQLSPPQSTTITTNPSAPLPQAISHTTQTSPSASPTSSPSTSPRQTAYHQSQVFYNQMHLRLSRLRYEIIQDFQTRNPCCRNPNPSSSPPRLTFTSSFEKRQEIAELQERVASMAQSIRDLGSDENVDAPWYDAASLGCVGEEEAAAEEAGEWGENRLTNEEVREAIAQAWREVYSERRLRRRGGRCIPRGS